MGVGGAGVAPNHGVEHVGVGGGEKGEEAAGVGEVAGVGEGGKGEEAAEGERVGDEAGAGHVGLDLLEVGHGGAGVFELGEDWVGDEESVVCVPFGLFGEWALGLAGESGELDVVASAAAGEMGWHLVGGNWREKRKGRCYLQPRLANFKTL